MHDIEVLRHVTGITRQVVRTNTAGVTHEESLVAPEPGGNCMNWVVGHLLHTYEQLLAFLEQPPVLGEAAVARYARGSQALHPGDAALPFDELLRGFDTACQRVDAGFALLTSEQLDAAAPRDFGKNLREMYGFVCFHQAYHAGQLGLLRRVVGKEGAIP